MWFAVVGVVVEVRAEVWRGVYIRRLNLTK